MKLTPLNDEERQILKLVVEEFYAVLPPALQVHSLFATHVLSNTLHRFGIRTRVLPCRLWCSSLQPPLSLRREVVGGVVNYGNPEKWNGHVVCIVGEWLVDAALYHLNPSFNYEVPKIIARRIARPEPGIYTRYTLNRNTEFIWYRLPPKASAVSVAGYEDFIDRFVNDLVGHLRRLLGYDDQVVAELAVDTNDAERIASADGTQVEDGDMAYTDPEAEEPSGIQSSEYEEPGMEPDEPPGEASELQDDSSVGAATDYSESVATAEEAEPVTA